jgi:hypothetical protein
VTLPHPLTFLRWPPPTPPYWNPVKCCNNYCIALPFPLSPCFPLPLPSLKYLFPLTSLHFLHSSFFLLHLISPFLRSNTYSLFPYYTFSTLLSSSGTLFYLFFSQIRIASSLITLSPLYFLPLAPYFTFSSLKYYCLFPYYTFSTLLSSSCTVFYFSSLKYVPVLPLPLLHFLHSLLHPI